MIFFTYTSLALEGPSCSFIFRFTAVFLVFRQTDDLFVFI